MGFSVSKYQRDVNKLEEVIDNVHNVPRERPLLIRILNKDRKQVQEPIFIESDKKSRIHELEVLKEGEKTPRIWTRILSETNVGTTVLFEGTVDGNTWAGSKYEYLSKYKRIADMVAAFVMICYTIAWAAITFQSGQGELTLDGLAHSFWFPLAIGMIAPSGLFYAHTRNDSSLDILELTVEEDATDSKDSQGYWCRLAHQQTDEQMEQSGIKAPEEYYPHVIESLDAVSKINASEYRVMRRKNTRMKSEIIVLKNKLAEKEDSEYSTRRSTETRLEMFKVVKHIALLLLIGISFWLLLKYEVIGG